MNVSIQNLVRTATTLVVVAVLSCSAGAHFDIFVTNLGTQTGIGGADVDGGVFDVDTRVFEGVMIASGTPDFSRNEPGFFALSNLAPGGLFPAGASALTADSLASLSFNPFTFNGNSGSLFYWNGVGAVDFQPAAGLVVSLSDSNELTGGNGELDFHPSYQIDDPGGIAVNGVYLATLRASVTGLAPSDPAYLVWLVDSSITNDEIAEGVEGEIEAGTAFQFFDEAVRHVEGSVVPEPGSLTITLLGLCGCLIGRHRTAKRERYFF